MKIRYLISEDELKAPCSLYDCDVASCTADYRKADGDSLLFLLPGVTFDTYKLTEEYVKSKPFAIVTENASKFPEGSENIIEVKNARRSFAHAMSRISEINYGALTFIGVTGTNGKTSTATMIHNILTDANIKCGFIGTGKIFFESKSYAEKNYSMTCPDPDLLYPVIKDMQMRGCTAIVIEASSHALELYKLSPIPFKIGIFTGLSHEHLEFHGNIENYFKAKERLIEAADTVIINFDDPWGKKLYEKYQEKSTGIGIIWHSDCNAKSIESRGLFGTAYIYKSKDVTTKISISLPGLYNVYNSMLSFCAAYKLNVPVKKIKDALERTRHIDGRFERFFSDITVIIDYAHTPFALEMLLKTINNIKKSEQKITLIFGCGGERDTFKRPLMAEIAEIYADRVIVTNDNPRGEDENKIISDIACGFKTKKHGIIKNRAAAIEYAIKSADENDIVVIAGQGHEKYIKDKNGVRDFDERIIIENSLKLRKKK